MMMTGGLESDEKEDQKKFMEEKRKAEERERVRLQMQKATTIISCS
jgi:hypothetical protein